MELRMRGYTYDELADTLGYQHRSSARKAVMRTVKERADLAVDLYRVHRYLVCEDILRRDFPLALRGDARALARCLRASGERMELHAGGY